MRGCRIASFLCSILMLGSSRAAPRAPREPRTAAHAPTGPDGTQLTGLRLARCDLRAGNFDPARLRLEERYYYSQCATTRTGVSPHSALHSYWHTHALRVCTCSVLSAQLFGSSCAREQAHGSGAEGNGTRCGGGDGDGGAGGGGGGGGGLGSHIWKAHA